jgi:hypothetical protein
MPKTRLDIKDKQSAPYIPKMTDDLGIGCDNKYSKKSLEL